MASDRKMLQAASRVACAGMNDPDDRRRYVLGAVGVRNDGVIVSAKNAGADCPGLGHHAETRLSRKLTKGSVVWVARVARKDGSWAMAKPCLGCRAHLRAAGATRVTYTVGPDEWGTLELNS